ncbi:cysteine peptidase family C39 domain-containing protein, partial [Paracidovorax anthurii]|uniref:cysteine peptidase family C39 domain-containing protein n=1 Tax=Paracidovorax anthurii TaxID=78229 RepID=UPI0039F0FB65
MSGIRSAEMEGAPSAAAREFNPHAGDAPGPSPVANHAALQALCLIARLHQVAAEPATLAHQLGLSASDAVGVQDLLLAAKLLGLKARRVRSGAERLTLAPLPALALVRAPGTAGGEDGGDEGAGGAGLHAVVLAQCDGQRVLLQDPGAAGAESGGGRPTIESVPEFTRRWTGELILVSSRASLAGELARFDFS